MAENLFAYFQTNQADALLWAHGSALKSFQQFSASVANRTLPVFPSIAFIDDADAQDFTGDGLLPGAYNLGFELMVQNQNPTTATTEARSYAAAVISMIRNCPTATLLADTGATTEILESIECGFDPIQTNDAQNDFMQQIEIRATYRLTAAAYS